MAIKSIGGFALYVFFAKFSIISQFDRYRYGTFPLILITNDKIGTETKKFWFIAGYIYDL